MIRRILAFGIRAEVLQATFAAGVLTGMLVLAGMVVVVMAGHTASEIFSRLVLR